MFDISNFLYTLLGIPYEHQQQQHIALAHQNDEEQQRNSDMPASPLLKYIYLNNWGASEKEKFIATCRKNFLVYIVTIETDMDDSTCPGCNKQLEECLSSKADSKHNINMDTQSEKSSSCRSKFCKSRENKKRESNSKLYRFIKKIIPSKTSRTKCTSSSFNEMFLRDYNFNDGIFKDASVNMDGPNKGNLLTHYITPQISYMEHNMLGESTNAETIREINELTNRIEQSEVSIKDLLIKYIQDGANDKDLANAVASHSRILGEVEKRTINLASEHWMQQVELYKEQQKNMQATMNSIIHQNRELLEENEMLAKRNEKLSATVLALKENSMIAPPKSATISSRYILDDLSKNNDRLRIKVSTIMNQIGDMEETCRKFQKRTQFLQLQLSNSSAQLYTSKVLYDKTKTEHELQVAKLLNELQINTGVLKECTENGNMIMQDLEVLQMQLQPIAKTINWDKFQKCTRPLPELIHLNRTCINELSSELMHKQNELNSVHSENENLKMVNSNLQPLKDEIANLRSKLEQSEQITKDYETDIKELNDSIATCACKLGSLTSSLNGKDNEIETKENTIKERNGEVKQLREIIENAKTDYSTLQFATDKLRHENNALQLQVKGMAQVLTATGAGDIAKELANTQEKLTAVQTQYFALAAENNIMLQQIDTNKSERQTLVAYQKSCYEQLQVLHKEIENLEKSNEALKEQLETEKQTVTVLQNERVRHLEERTILTAIYERLKSEISKVDQLEGAVSSMNKKASKLAMIAEYNKQLGEKLQTEVAERDVAINELQNNVKQLNSFQMECTKEKVALCEELNKVFSVKEVLNTKLTAELEKNVILDESKKEIQNSANLQLKEIQAAYNREHAALKNLVRDVKQLVVERDSLMDTNKECESKCINMMIEQNKLVEFIKELQIVGKEKEKKLEEVEELLVKRGSDMEALKRSNENDIGFLRSKYEMISNQVDSLNKENDSLKGTLEYLQSDLNKTRADLEQTRQCEHEWKKNVDEMQHKCESLMQECNLKSAALEEIIAENQDLKINVYSLGEKYKCLTEENERISQDTVRLESMLAEKFQTAKLSGHPTPKHVENVLDDINARDEEILILQDRLREFEERGMELNDLLQTISENRDSTEMRNKQLQDELHSALVGLNSARQQTEELESIIQEMQPRRNAIDDFEEQQNHFNTAIEQVKNDYNAQFQTLAREMNEFDQQKEQQKEQQDRQLQETSENLQKYKEAHEKLQKAHKVLALKLFTAVRVLICEKVSLENAQSRIKSLTDEKKEYQQYKEENESEIFNYQSQIEMLKQELQNSKDENAMIIEDVKSAREFINELEEKLIAAANLPNAMDLQETIKDQELRIVTIKNQLEENRKSSDSLQEIIANLESTCACMEFEKSETILRLHELQTRTQAEITRNEEMKNAMQSTLGLIIEMKEKGLITPYVHNELLQSFSDHV